MRYRGEDGRPSVSEYPVEIGEVGELAEAMAACEPPIHAFKCGDMPPKGPQRCLCGGVTATGTGTSYSGRGRAETASVYAGKRWTSTAPTPWQQPCRNAQSLNTFSMQVRPRGAMRGHGVRISLR